MSGDRSSGCCGVGNRSGNGVCAAVFGNILGQSVYGGNPGGKNCAEPGNIKNGFGRDAIGNCGTVDAKKDGFECVGVGGDDSVLWCGCDGADCGPDVVSQNRLCFDNDVTVLKL